MVGTVREAGARARQRDAGLLEDRKTGVERNRAQGHEHARARDERELAPQVLAAVAQLIRKRPVVRRRAPRCRGDQRPGNLQAIARANRLGTVRQTHRVQRAKEEVARLVSREDPTRPVAAVRGGREPHDEQPPARIAEPRHRPRPVGLAGESAGRIAGHFLTPRDEARAAAAGDDLALELAVVLGQGYPRV
jgi:hypothetical protein